MFKTKRISLSHVFQTFSILEQCSRILGLTIDNRLTLATNDCYTRISIGSKLPVIDIALRINVISLTECEENCSKYQNDCNAFSFGVGTKGNSTCLISPRIPMLENLESHSEYDVYAKRRQDSLWCNLDDTIHGSFIGGSEIRSTKAKKLNKNELVVNIGDPLLKLVPKPVPILIPISFPRNINDMANYGQLDKYFLSDDNNRKIADKNERTLGNLFGLVTSRYNALNWNRNWKSSESRYSDVTNGNTFPSSRINYDKGYFGTMKPSIFSNSQLGDRSLTQEFSIPNENEQHYGKWYNYGSAFDYNGNYASVRKESCYEKHETLEMIHKCSVKVVSGSKLSRAVLRKTCAAHNLKQCEEFCINEASFSCESFAYRCNILTTNPTDNCLLSDHSYRDLHFYTDLEPNRDYNSYILMPDTKTCYLRKFEDRYPLEECFSRIRSGFTMPVDVTKKAVLVNDLGECQFACTASQEFLCKSFVFEYAVDNPSKRRNGNEDESSNCFLTDWTSEEINPIDMPDMDGAELYERNTFSYGCDTYPLPLPVPNVITSNNKGPPSPMHMDQLCYSEYHRPCRLMSHAIVSSMRAVTKSDCRRKCSTMRNAGMIPSCMSFNYIIPNNDNTENNCFLSDISIRDLRPNLDYVHDNDHRLYSWKEFDPYCSLSYANTQKPSEDSGTDGIIGSPFYSSAIRWKSKFRYDSEEKDYKHKLVNGDNESFLNSDRFKHGHNFLYPGQVPSSRRYTINGYPCKNDTVCQRNEITGFWSCEIENEHGNWDYCCEPGHHCGFSQGYHYPWCYVGSNEDQWRPCSETYFPYYFTKEHSTYRQSPIHAARHWPVIYFHETSPPNCSTSDHPDIKNS